jgi:predicted GTPase
MQPSGDAFDVLSDAARELGDEAAAADVLALRTRVEEGRFFVACVGQFKRGKSTLLNALVGASVLPVGVVPVTAVVTVLRHGSELRARVRTDAAGWRDVPQASLDEYVSEEKNPENGKGVRAVEVYVPSSLLASGMCLVDTPGLGSVFAENTAATREFVPHIDAALVVLGADPPISGEELELVADVGRQVDHLVFVINKVDRLSGDDVAQACAFTRDVLAKRLSQEASEILVVSAAERTSGCTTRDWSALESRLTTLARGAGADLVEGARRRGLSRISSRLVQAVGEHKAALLRPLDESELRLATLTRAVDDAERALVQLEPLFRLEEESLRHALDVSMAAFLAEARPKALADLRERLEAAPERPAALRKKVFDFAEDVARGHLHAWAERVRPEAEEAYRRATDRFVTMGNDFLRRLQATAPDAFATLPAQVEPESGLRARSHFYFTQLLTIATPSPGAGVLYALRSREQAIRAAHKRATPYLLRLLDANSSRVIQDLAERVRESGRRLRGEIGALLRAVTATARRGAERAKTSRERGGDAVREELARLEALQDELARAVA